MLFDTHAHYDDERFDEDRDTLLASMPENNVGLILNPGCDVESSRKAVSYANKYPFVYAAVGIHPENIEDGWEADLETIRALAQNESKVRAIGEIGLDYYWDKENHEKQEYEEMFLERTAEHTRAFIKVQDGCNQFCSYCIIPFARGRVRSRNSEDVIREVKRLAEHGFREIVLTGIHLSSYGVDTGDNLLHLIREVHNVDGIERIRLGSLEPRIVTDGFAAALAGLPKICPHFHLSLQSGCDATLQRMNRRYDTREYEEGCQILRKYFDHPAITTDVIVGFPGETEEEFAVTKEYLKRIHFYEMHIFQYSKREGTKAAVMEHQVPEPVKKERSNILLALEKKMSEEFREYYVGKQVTALMEEAYEFEGETYFTGYTKEYVKIAVKSAADLSNQFVKGTIRGRLTDDIYLMVEF